MNLQANAVELKGLSKYFAGKAAVDGIDLEIPHGCFLGLVGPNGAGKTTTLRMITGLLRPDAGLVLINGQNAWTDPVSVKAIIGVLPEELRLFDRLSGKELLTYNGLLRGMPEELVLERSAELIDVLGLADAADKLVVDYSHGMQKKIALAAALLHGPQILFLDEPFEAIDPVSSRAIRSVLERHIASGATVVFSSHVMELVEKLCDRVAIMHEGRIVAGGPLDEIIGGDGLEDKFIELVGSDSLPEKGLKWLGSSSD